MTMSIIALKRNRICGVIGIPIVVFVFCYLVSSPVDFLWHYTNRFVDGLHPPGGFPIHSYSDMILPSVAVESGRTLCCRMDLCDFRFPLPKRSVVVMTDSISGGSDTIHGAIYVTNLDGGKINLQDYAGSMHRAGFKVSSVEQYGFTANSPDGSYLEVHGGQTTKIIFQFFGDY